MRKLISLISAFLLILSVSSGAAGVSVELINAGEDIIRAYGSAKEGETVSVMILNPGFSADDVRANKEGAAAYYGKTRAGKDGLFSLEIGMYDEKETGGVYTIFVSTKNAAKPDTDTFKFYFNSEKLKVIDKIGTDAETGSLVEELYSVYGLDELPIYTETPFSTLTQVFEREEELLKDSDKIYEYLKKTLYTAAYKSGNSALISDGKISGADIIGLEGTDLYNDYLTLLSSDGMNSVNNGLLGNKCDNLEKVSESFNELVLLHLICDYKDMGFGHVEEIFEKYDDELKKAGIDPEKLEDISNKNSVYLALVNSDADTLSLLSEDYEDALLVADKPSEENEKRPAQNTKPSVTGTTGTGKVPSSGPSGDSGYIHKPKNPFTDLAAVSWADEAISVLYEKGVISGKDEKTFAPNDLVTREEFTKMIVLTFLGEAGGEASFSDVSGWSAPYIGTAAEAGLISGSDDGLFYPKDNITREQAASIVWRALSAKDYEGNSGKAFSDETDISDYAKTAVKMLRGAEVLAGREDNMFCPKDNMTRAEAAKIIYYAYKLIEGGAA